MDTRDRIAEGANVYGSDGGKVGSVIAIQPSYIVVEKGFFFPTDYYIPMGAVATVADDGIYLNVTKEAALNQGWNTEPVIDYAATDYSRADLATDVTAGAASATGEWSAATDADTIRVPVYEEELTATTRPRAVGEVRVTKDVVAEERTIDVPVTEERVRVTHRTVDRPLTATDTAADTFEEVVIEVPVRGETVDVQKRVRVAEEVEIAKERVQRTERVSDTVRREEVHVDDETAGAGADVR